MPNTELSTARRLIHIAIAQGLTISVNDGEATTVKRSTNPSAILEAINTTGEDILTFHNTQGEFIGNMVLIWGNDPEGLELISDYTGNTAMKALCYAAYAPPHAA